MDIRVECVTPDGLSGKKRVWFRGIFHLIGILGESPFVSKLRKAESAQHSVQWTGGYAPRFLGFFLALGFSRFDGESTLLPTAANANCGLPQHVLHAQTIRKCQIQPDFR